MPAGMPQVWSGRTGFKTGESWPIYIETYNWLGMLTTVDLADRLRVSVGRLARRLRQQSLGGLTPSQSSILATLDRHGPMNMSDLAEHEGIRKPSATGIVGRLIDKALVAKEADPRDGRSTIVTITAGGHDLLVARRRERTAYLARQVESLDPEDRAVLERAVELFEKMVDDR
jgi:DNA-binding MarR family transcriptional regulator